MAFDIRKAMLLLSTMTTCLCIANVSKADIKVGASAPKTGPLASAAAVVYWPVLQYWVDEVNSRGGLKLKDGMHKVALIEYDDRTNPQEAIQNYERLVNKDKADLLIAPYGTAYNLAVAPIFNKNNFPHLAASAVTDKMPELANRYKNMFFLLGGSKETAESVSKVFVKLRNDGKVGNKIAMVNVADAFGIESANAARPVLKEAGFDLVYDKSYPLGAQDLATVVKGAKAANPDIFIAWSYPPDSFALGEQARIEQLGSKVFFLALGTAYPGFAGRLKEFAEGTLGLGGASADDPLFKEYFEGVKKVTGKEPDYAGSIVFYASLQALAQSIEGVGELDRVKITEYLKTQPFKTAIHDLRFDNQISHNVWTMGQWQNGKFYGVADLDRPGAKPIKMKDNWK